jgi:hypothetical protein
MPVMRTLKIAACVLLLAATGDRLAPPHTSLARAADAAVPTTLDRFTLFGWVSPPPAFADSARYAEMALAGLDLVLPALDDTGGIVDMARAQLELAAANGLRVLVWDARFERMSDPGIDRDSLFDVITADYGDHPALAGYYLGDEPMSDQIPLLADAHARLRARDPTRPGWNNLLGRSAFADAAETEAHLRAYLDAVRPAVLCNALYEFSPAGDRGHFFDNVTVLSALARERGIPFWSIVQLVEHRGHRALTAGELRWQVSHLLAYGAHGVGYFTYWTPPDDPFWKWAPAVITTDGERTAWFDLLAEFNPRVRAIGETLMSFGWIATEHAGSVPPGAMGFVPDDWVSQVEGRAAIGQFTDRDGARHLLVVNSDSAASQRIALNLPEADSVAWLAAPERRWEPASASPVTGGMRIEVLLEAGDMRLLRVFGANPGSSASGARPGLDLSPNPARGACRFAVAAAVGGAVLEVLDASGRRVWARALPPGRSSVEWRGERDTGGRIPPGLYFARLRDDRGAAVRRLVWLGTE